MNMLSNISVRKRKMTKKSTELRKEIQDLINEEIEIEKKLKKLAKKLYELEKKKPYPYQGYKRALREFGFIV